MNRIGSKKYCRAVVYLFFFAVVFLIAYWTPYCHDEWKWGLPERLALMKRGFANYNGRYLGDILSIIITRSVLAKTLIMSGVLTGILYVMDRGIMARGTKENQGERLFLLLFAVCLLFVLPQTLYAQSYGWSAAFVNFVPPVLLFLLYYNWTEDLYCKEDKEVRSSAGKSILAFLLALATQLFSEHITLFVLLYGAWVIVVSAVRRRKVALPYLTYFAGALAGALLMFSNGAYKKAAAGKGYKAISVSLASMYHQLCDVILDNLFLNNTVLNVLMVTALILLIMRREKRMWSNLAMTAFSVFFGIYCIWNKTSPDLRVGAAEDIIKLVVSAVWFLCMLLCVWKNMEGRGKYSVCVLLCSSAAAAVPLLAANPIGPRCFYFCYVLQCVALLKIVAYLVEGKVRDFSYPAVVVAVTAVILGAVYLRIFYANGMTDRERREIMNASVQNNAKQVTLPSMPYPQYCWITIPPNEEWEEHFKNFYGIPLEMELVFE